SVTIPHKVSLLERADEVDALAKRIGAINTIRIVDGRWQGRNTDAAGVLAPLQGGVDVRGLRVGVVRAGGGGAPARRPPGRAARAVVVALAPLDCATRVHARNPAQAAEVAALGAAAVGPWPPEPGTWDLLVNCTPIGMYPRVDETPVPARALTGRVVYDLIYNPAVTRLLGDAKAAGCRTIGGLGMLVAQGEEQFRWWTDGSPPPGVMRAAAERRLAEFVRDEHYVV